MALVGESGSGKSTLAKLLVHYYDVADGAITIGGQDLREMSLAALNDHISYVAQDQYLFNTSLLENIRLGRPDATEDEVRAAADKAQCTEFLARLPQGIHTPAGDAGKMLSGGQRQRISLAPFSRMRRSSFSTKRPLMPILRMRRRWKPPSLN